MAYHEGSSDALGPAGVLISILLVIWAASFGIDESGIFNSDSTYEVTRHRKMLCDRWVKEVLNYVDGHGILRKPTFDSVRALLLLLPLAKGERNRVRISQHVLTIIDILTPLERLVSPIYSIHHQFFTGFPDFIWNYYHTGTDSLQSRLRLRLRSRTRRNKLRCHQGSGILVYICPWRCHRWYAWRPINNVSINPNEIITIPNKVTIRDQKGATRPRFFPTIAWYPETRHTDCCWIVYSPWSICFYPD